MFSHYVLKAKQFQYNDKKWRQSIETTSDEKRTFPKTSATERNKFVTPDGYTIKSTKHMSHTNPLVCDLAPCNRVLANKRSHT